MILFCLSFCEVSLGGGISVSMSAMYNVLCTYMYMYIFASDWLAKM